MKGLEIVKEVFKIQAESCKWEAEYTESLQEFGRVCLYYGGGKDLENYVKSLFMKTVNLGSFHNSL